MWGAVHLLHPWLHDGAVDPDGAWLEAIREAIATEGTDLAALVGRALEAMGDPLTTVSVSDPEPSSEGEPDESIEGFSHLRVRELADLEQREAEEHVLRWIDESSSSTGLIVDLRGVGDSWALEGVWRALPMLVGRRVVLELCTRFHSGWDAGLGLGQYFNALMSREWRTIEPDAQEMPRSVAVMIDGDTGIDGLLAAQALGAGGVSVVASGNAAVPGTAATMALGTKITVSIRTSESRSNGRGFVPDAHVSGASALARTAALLRSGGHATHVAEEELAVARNEDVVDFTTREGRVLGLYRMWTTIKHFFAYVDLADRPWDDALEVFLPRVADASSNEAYVHALAEACAWMDDSHAGLAGPIATEVLGGCVPPLGLEIVEGRIVVAAEGDEAGLSVGDVVLAVDGRPVDEVIESYELRTAASSPEARRYQIVNRQLLSGPQDSLAHITVESVDGHTRTVSTERSVRRFARDGAFKDPGLPVFGTLESGFGFFDLTRLRPEQVDEAMESVFDAPAIIMDMRGYPKGVFPTLAPWFTTSRKRAALFRRPEVREPLSGRVADCRSEVWFSQWVEPGDSVYQGRVAVLVDVSAVSQAEHTCLWLEAACSPVFIGSPTRGTNGDVTAVEIAQGLHCMFTGHDVRHGDGRQLQRIGIQPTVNVRPTIDGIRRGRDEVLEAAVAYLS